MSTLRYMEHYLHEAKGVLETMLQFLGFSARVEENLRHESGPCLEVHCEESELLIGKQGERLNEMQFLLNKLIQERHRDAGRIRIDIDGYRAKKEAEELEKIKELGEKVKETGESVTLEPMNSFYRRAVHQLFEEDELIETESVAAQGRNKRVKICKKAAAV